MKNLRGIKVSIGTINFLKKLITNRRKVGTDDADIAYWKALKTIEQYFKQNNEAYLELTKIEWSDKNV